MLILASPDQSLELVLGGAVNADEPEFVASFVDVAAPDTYEPHTQHGETTGDTPVTAIAAPATGRRRQVKFVCVFNADDQAATVTVQLRDDVTVRRIVEVDLPVGATLVYTDGEGFRVLLSGGGVAVEDVGT